MRFNPRTRLANPAIRNLIMALYSDELRGQVAAAFIILKPGIQPSDALKKEIIGNVRQVMGPIVVFKDIAFVNLLPKTRSGKIMRRVVRKLWLGEELGDISTIETETSVDEVREAVSKLRRIH